MQEAQLAAPRQTHAARGSCVQQSSHTSLGLSRLCGQKRLSSTSRSDASRTMLRTGDLRGVAGAAHNGEERQRATHFTFGIVLLRHQQRRVCHVALSKPLAKVQLLLGRQSALCQQPGESEHVQRAPWPQPRPRHAQHAEHAGEPAAVAHGTRPVWGRARVRRRNLFVAACRSIPAGFVKHPYETLMRKYCITLACDLTNPRYSMPN